MSNSADTTVQGALKINLGEWSANLKVAVADIARASDTMEKDLLAVSKQATAQLGSLAKEVEQATAGFARMESQLGDVRLLMSGVDQTTADIAVELKAARAEASQFATASLSAFGDVRVLLNAVDENIHKLTQHMTQAATAAKEVKPPPLPEPVSVNRWNEGLRSLAGIAGTVSPHIGQLVSAFTAVEGAAKSAGVSMGTAAVAVGSVLAAIAGVRAAFNFTLEGIKLAADMEQVSIAFETMTGSAERASKLMRELKEFANTTPFRFPEIAGAAKQLLAMGIESDRIVDTLRRLGDVSSGLSQPLGEMAYLFGQIKSQGRAMTQDLNQFAGRGVPIYRELAAVLGTTELGVRELAEKGQIGFAEIEKAIRRMSDTGGQFFDMTKRQSQSLLGLTSTLEDAWTDVKTAAGEAFNDQTGKAMLTDLTKAISDLKPAIADASRALVDAIKTVLPMVKELLSATMSFADFAGLTDRFRDKTAQGPDLRPALGMLAPDASGVDKLDSFFKGYASVNRGSAGSLQFIQDLERGGEVSPQLYDRIIKQITAYNAGVPKVNQTQAVIEKLKADVAAGRQVDAAEFAAAQKTVGDMMGLGDQLAASMRNLHLELNSVKDATFTRPIIGTYADQLSKNNVSLNGLLATMQKIAGPLNQQAKEAAAAASANQPTTAPSGQPRDAAPERSSERPSERPRVRSQAASRGRGWSLESLFDAVPVPNVDPIGQHIRDALGGRMGVQISAPPSVADEDPSPAVGALFAPQPTEATRRAQERRLQNRLRMSERGIRVRVPIMAPLFEPGRSPADAARNAVDSASNLQPAAAAGSNSPTINVNAPNYNNGELADALADRLKPYIDQSIAHVKAETVAADHRSRAKGGY